jgi:hypothetical protein
MTISNWNGSARFTPAAVVAPRDVEELKRFVTNGELPSPLRAVGELHSLNDSVVTDGTIVFMTHFNRIWYPQRYGEHQTVRVGAGVRMIDLKNALKKRRLQLEVVPEIGNATAGSVACCGTKDSSLRATGPGQISATVVAVRMVTSDGRDVLVTDEEDLRYARSSYGLLGVIYEVTFAVQRRVKVKYQYASVDLGQCLTRGDPLPGLHDRRILGDAHGFLGFLLPYKRQLLVERRTIARVQMRFPGWDGLKLALRTFAWRTGARPFVSPLRYLPRGLRHWLVAKWINLLENGFLKLFFLRVLGKFASFRADAMIDFRRPVSSYFEFTFWAFPVGEWQTVVPAYFKFCDEYLRRTGFRPGLPTEVYFIRKDQPGQGALLSFCPDQDIFTLDMVNWTDEAPACWREMNEAFNEFAARHGGRPLLNQTKWLTAEVARLLRTPEWQALSDTREAEDPRGRFLTPYFRAILPAPHPVNARRMSWR